MKKGITVCVIMGMVWLAAQIANANIANTLHNLSSSGPGTVRATGVTEICIFCHTPHHAGSSQPLWNRDIPPQTYNLYTSTTTEATLQQPTGASRLCLSCHDGTIALGNLRVPPSSGPVALPPLTGRAALGTDLSDDHPISFVYDSSLAIRRGELATPLSLPKSLPLDETQQVQCTTCHEPHDDRYRKFLRMDDRAGALCSTCHQRRGWIGSAHATSQATWKGGGTNPWPDSPYTTVADNGCTNCHRPHSVPRPPRLLRDALEPEVCLVCHNGSTATKNISAEFSSKFSIHPISSSNWTHEPRENLNTMPRHVTCVDCHNPHQATPTPSSPPTIPGVLRGVQGMNISGGVVQEAVNEYEVCLKCHGVTDQTTPSRVIRQDNTRNVRLEISPGNLSYHPIAATGKNTTMSGFEPGYSTGSMIYCTDCHNNDQWSPSGNQPRGPHGSQYQPILEREYQVNDPTTETFQSYAMCYKCHSQSYIINDVANKFPHKEHVTEKNTSCAVCHDAHGSRQNAHLINFMLRDPTGKVVVTPSSSGRLEYISLSTGSGQCYLTCHGKDHNPLNYPDD